MIFSTCAGLFVSFLAIPEEHRLWFTGLLCLNSLWIFAVLWFWLIRYINTPLKRLNECLQEPEPNRNTLLCRNYYALQDIAEHIRANLQYEQIKLANETQIAFKHGSYTEQRQIAQAVIEALSPAVSLSNQLEQLVHQNPTANLDELIAKQENHIISANKLLIELKKCTNELIDYHQQLRRVSFSLYKNIRKQYALLKGQIRDIGSVAHFAASGNQQPEDTMANPTD